MGRLLSAPFLGAISSMWVVILVVDDEPSVCRLIEQILKTAGHCVYTAHTVDKAVAIADMLGHELDILICDIFLQNGTSGVEVVRRVQPLCPQASVILISGDFFPDDDTPFKLGNHHHLVLAKPFSKAQLLEVITRAINQSEGTKT